MTANKYIGTVRRKRWLHYHYGPHYTNVYLYGNSQKYSYYFLLYTNKKYINDIELHITANLMR